MCFFLLKKDDNFPLSILRSTTLIQFPFSVYPCVLCGSIFPGPNATPTHLFSPESIQKGAVMAPYKFSFVELTINQCSSTKRPCSGTATSLKWPARKSRWRVSSSPIIGCPWLGTAREGFSCRSRLTDSSAACQSTVRYLGGPLICSFWVKTDIRDSGFTVENASPAKITRSFSRNRAIKQRLLIWRLPNLMKNSKNRTSRQGGYILNNIHLQDFNSYFSSYTRSVLLITL